MSVFDFHTVSLVFAVALLGGLVGLDRTAVGQFMISQPLVAGPVTGWLLGDLAAGAVIGSVLELIWVLDLPIGTFVPADATIAAVSAVAIAVLGGRGKASLDLIGFSILLTTAMVPVTMMADEFVRKRNGRLGEAAVAASGEHVARRLSRAQATGVLVFFLKSFLLCLLLIPAGLAAVVLFAQLPGRIHRGMELFVKTLPLLGAALILHKLSLSAVDRFFLAGFAGALALSFLIPGHPVVVIALIVVAGLAAVKWGSERNT
jgi:mannose/fructose/N-acetylgalactosamine-specific phosphotransferase system component IIC